MWLYFQSLFKNPEFQDDIGVPNDSMNEFFSIHFFYKDKAIACLRQRLDSYVGIFFLGGGGLRNFFKVTLMSLFEIQNVFMIIKNDVLDRLGHG